MTRPTPSTIRGLRGEIRDIVYPHPPPKQIAMTTTKIVPWLEGKWMHPLLSETKYGYTQFLYFFPSVPIGGIYTISNVIDGYTMVKVNGTSFNDINMPDLIIPPLGNAQIRLEENDSLLFVTNAFGYDWITTSATGIPYSSRSVSPINPNVGIFIGTEKNPILPTAKPYTREYDIYDLSITFPSSQTTSPPKGTSTLSLTFDTGQVLTPAMDGTGASTLSIGFQIGTVSTNSGATGTIEVFRYGSGQILASADFSITPNTIVNLPDISSGLGPGINMEFIAKNGASTTLSLSSIYARFGVQ